MAKQKSKSNHKLIVILIGLILATLGYVSYKSILTTPNINKIDDTGNSNGDAASKTNSNKLNNRNSNYGTGSSSQYKRNLILDLLKRKQNTTDNPSNSKSVYTQSQ